MSETTYPTDDDGQGVPVPADDEQAGEEKTAMMFTRLDGFVAWLASWYRRPVDGQGLVWTDQWWQSPEVLLRMEGMWRAFETARTGAGPELSLWIRDHVDHHMTIILRPDGPLFRYGFDGTAKALAGGSLPVAAPPPGMFLDEVG